jgi:hypothetical protein
MRLPSPSSGHSRVHRKFSTIESKDNTQKKITPPSV